MELSSKRSKFIAASQSKPYGSQKTWKKTCWYV